MANSAVAGLNLTLVDMATGYFRSRALAAAARLNIASTIGDSERTVEELAAACGAEPASLYRLLRALASFGIVAETRPGSFRLTPFGQPLRKEAPGSAWHAVVFWADLLADSWSYLTECIRAGKPSRDVRPPEAPSRWAQDPEAGAVFRAVMGTSPAEDYMPIARAWDFSRYGTAADLGGGGGALIAAILEAHPSVSGMLVDNEHALANAAARFQTPGLAQRCRLLSADLRESVPAGADVYILKHVLHGYDDVQASGILRHCGSVLPAGGRVLIVEFVLPDVIDHADPDLEARLMSDLNMLAVTGGKERSAAEWKQLVSQAGLDCLAIIPVPGDLVSILEVGRPN